jgi:YidC/Oxa1 family membrane protein insertase
MLSRLRCVGTRCAAIHYGTSSHFITISQVDTSLYHIFIGATAVAGASVVVSLTWHRPLNACQRVGLYPYPLRVQPSLATRSIWLFSKREKADAAPPAAAPPSTVPSQPVAVPETASGTSVTPLTPTADAVPADAIAQVSSFPQSEILDTAAALAPLQYGDLAVLGLAGWSPAGLSSWMLELVNVSTGLPWFHTIVVGTFLSRLLLLPFSIKQLRNTAALAPYQPRLLELKDEFNRVYATGDQLAVQRIALKQRSVYEESGVSMLPMLLMPFVQLPVTLGMFFGIKGLCALPLEQLHWSGVSFLPDLTVPDPYYILPIASAVLINLQLAVGAMLIDLPPFF